MARTVKHKKGTCAWCGWTVRTSTAAKHGGKLYCADGTCGGSRNRRRAPRKQGRLSRKRQWVTR